MSPLDIVLKYFDIFYSGRDLDRLLEIMADDLEFSGPFYTFDTAAAYVESLTSNPPVDFDYEILHTFENGPLVNVIYTFLKPGVRTPMSQLFDIRDKKIRRILLIFDTSQF